MPQTDQILQVEKCRCDVIPLPHVSVVIDGCRYHPVFSKTGIKTCLEKNGAIDLYDEIELSTIRKCLRSLDVPEFHPFDIAAIHLECEEVDIEEEVDVQQAHFRTCPLCGRHGDLIDHRGVVLAVSNSKEEALRELHDHTGAGHIRIEDEKKVREEIRESSLPDRVSDIGDDAADDD